MLGEVDVTPVAAQQTAELGQQVGPGWVIALDLSDIAKPNARAMPYLHKVHDGSTGAIVQGYGLATEVAVDLFGQQKQVPLPLNFEVFSAAEEDFKSQPALWLEMIDRISAVTKHGTFVLDREGDNRRIIDRFVDRKRDFVLRVNTHEHSRLVLFGKSSRARVMDAWKEAEFYGELEARRLHSDGGSRPYRADYGALEVRIPGIRQSFWLCVFDSPDHAAPMVLLTSHRADSSDAVIRVLSMYFGRWVVEEMHRFAKQSFQLENIRALTWTRLRNLVAATWIALGAIARFSQRSDAEQALRTLELLSHRLIAPLRRTQFWGYALLDGLRAGLNTARNLLPLLGAWSRPPAPTTQGSLFGARA